jgi:tyrosine-protein kinase Etk/Wzc
LTTEKVLEPTTTRDEVRVSAIAASVLQHRGLIVRCVLTALLLAFAYYLFRPKTYTAVSTLVPAQSAQSDLSLLATQLGVPLPIRQNGGNERMLNAVARSRLMADSMVKRLLPGKADPVTESELRVVLAQKTVLRTNPDASLSVEVKDSDPKRAARVANEFPSLLNKLVTDMGVQVSQRKQEYLRRQLSHALAELQQSEQRLVTFKSTGTTPVIDAQAQQTVAAAGDLQRSVMEQEIRIAQMRRTMTSDNPELQAALGELATRREQLRRLTTGSSHAGQVYVPMRAAPEIKAVEARLQREYQRDEQIYTSLAAAVAQTQIDMNNTLPIVSVLDAALVPTQPTGMPLMTLLVLATVLGLLAGLALTLWTELWTRAQRDPESGVLVTEWTDLKHDVLRWIPVKRKTKAQLAP